MANKKVETLLKKIETTKNELIALGDMRPGSVTKQFHKRRDEKWPYWQMAILVLLIQNTKKTSHVLVYLIDQQSHLKISISGKITID